MNTHELKCHPHFFAAIAAGKKTFEIRRNDRDYRIGDMLNLREYDPTFGHTGRRLSGLEVVYIMQAEDFPAILPGFIIMGLRGVPSMEDEREPAKQIGELVAKLPVTQQLERCNEYRKVAGLVLPRTCAECGLGPCKYPKGSDDDDKA
ncbi:hypothetical protein P9A30_gp44 [Sphingomonas phage Lucius]|uniref:DUF3850 domain-containing protein n=1 Tax=Sphingomonas phage Lucius TaxID=2686313 RepID=A0A6M3T856_9CAUD|nr:hypothetical protein P9A30_gp44 [Sphingomonas phage Lucius]QJD54486.1 hypothetical protein [Sphingomonas phage Lucius]